RRVCTLAGSKPGSNCSATCTMASAKPGTLAPMTLIGNSDGYSISDCSGGMSFTFMRPQMGARRTNSNRLRRLRALIGLEQARVHRPRLAAQRAVADRIAVEGRHRQHF